MQHIWLSVRLWLCKVFLKPFLKTTQLPPSSWQCLEQDVNGSDICIIINGYQAADHIALEYSFKVSTHIDPDTLSFIYLPQQLDASTPSETLQYIREKTKGKRLLLASVFWGRQADRNNSFWRTYFAQAYGSTTALRRAVTVLIQARQVNCYIRHIESTELDLSTLIQIRQQLQTLRESVTGPDPSHKRTLLSKVLQSEAVIHCIKELADSEGLNPEKSRKQASKFYKEIAADYSYPTLRFLDILLRFVWQKIYKGIDIHNFEAVNRIAQTHQIIYTPCHRSHIDYLLLSYTIYHQGLMPPHIAAGLNLNLPIIGNILRKGGAFFIRRQFRDQKLYRAVFESYVNQMIELGTPLEYFVEGGRSRTGLLLPARPGMLAMTVRSSLKPSRDSNKTQKPIAFIPVYIGYEKLVESHSYINELYGSKKEKESIRSLFAARKLLLLNYGKVYVNFAEPIFLNDIKKQAPPVLTNTELTSFCVDQLCHQIPTEINQASILTPANVIATALLSSSRHALLEDQLKQQVALLESICDINQTLNISKLNNSQAAIDHCTSIEFIQCQAQDWGQIYSLDQRGQVNATFLRNNTLHNFILPAIIASVLIRHQGIHKKKIINTCRRLLPFIQSELFINLNNNNLSKRVQQYLELFVSSALITEEKQHYFTYSSESESFYQLSLLSGSSKAAIERFYITAECLLNKDDKHYTRKSLENQCIELAQQLALLHTFHAPDFFDKNLFRTFINQLIEEQLLIEDESGLLSSQRRLILSAKLASQVLSTNALRNIKQLASRGKS